MNMLYSTANLTHLFKAPDSNLECGCFEPFLAGGRKHKSLEEPWNCVSNWEVGDSCVFVRWISYICIFFHDLTMTEISEVMQSSEDPNCPSFSIRDDPLERPSHLFRRK